jgi:hypothetical protein
MLDYADLIARIEKLEISDANRFIARAHFSVAEANVNRLVRALDWRKRVGGTWGRNRAATALKSNSLLAG